MTFTVFFVNERILPGARLVYLSRPLNGRFLQNLMWFSCFLEKSKDHRDLSKASILKQCQYFPQGRLTLQQSDIIV